MPTLTRLAADAVVLGHLGYVAFVVVGQLLILVGWLKRWRWIQNVWFRGIHLTAITVVVLESWFEIVCPLTTLEQWLRERDGGNDYHGDFLASLAHDLLFVDWPPWAFTAVYTGFGGLVLFTLLLAPPRRRRAS